ncbi:MAG: DUF192 domain-containing protein [Candidatus Paceibacterota bacterium]
MKTSLVVLIAVVIIFAGALIFAGKNSSINQVSSENSSEPKENLKSVVARIGGSHLVASVANTDRSRSQGFSNVKSISPNEGKMFTFDKEDYYTFHMKDMNFSLDFIFVNDQGNVVDIVKNVNPDFKGLIKPAYPASTVFEVSAGWADQNNIKVGQTVSSVNMQ